MGNYLSLCRGNIRKQRLLRPDGNLGTHRGHQPGESRLWRIIFRLELQKHLMWNLLTSHCLINIWRKLELIIKKHGGKPVPPQVLMGRYPDFSETCGCNCQEWVISVRCLSDGRQTGQSVSPVYLWERLAPAGFNPWWVRGVTCFFKFTRYIFIV